MQGEAIGGGAQAPLSQGRHKNLQVVLARPHDQGHHIGFMGKGAKEQNAFAELEMGLELGGDFMISNIPALLFEKLLLAPLTKFCLVRRFHGAHASTIAPN